MLVATLFASQELGADAGTLMFPILMIQFVAFFGSLIFGWLAGRIGAKSSLSPSLVIWAAISIYASALLYDIRQLFILGAAVAMVLGGSQALSRSLYSQLIPRENESEYFGFYEISDRGTSWVGPLIFCRGSAANWQFPCCYFVSHRVFYMWSHAPDVGQCQKGHGGC